MSLFYFDETIQNYEQKLDYEPIIEYLENIYHHTKDIKIYITIIADAWYYLVEGDVNQRPSDYHWEYFQKKLKTYIEFGLNRKIEDERFLWTTGYILHLHWMYINDAYEGLGVKLMRKCLQNSTDKNMKILSEYILDNKKIVQAKSFAKNLFPSNSELDKYFSHIINCN